MNAVHLLMGGHALCGAGMPSSWPEGDRWVAYNDPDWERVVNCVACGQAMFPRWWTEMPRDPDSFRAMVKGIIAFDEHNGTKVITSSVAEGGLGYATGVFSADGKVVRCKRYPDIATAMVGHRALLDAVEVDA